VFIRVIRIANIGDIRPGEMRAFTELIGAYLAGLG
jgi:hypothetical protein